MIASYRNKFTRAIAEGSIRKGFPPDLVRQSQRKLNMIENAASLDDLRSPPNNRFEKLSGDREGQSSIRINDQWRICFRWIQAGAEDVEIVDYH